MTVSFLQTPPGPLPPQHDNNPAVAIQPSQPAQAPSAGPVKPRIDQALETVWTSPSSPANLEAMFSLLEQPSEKPKKGRGQDGNFTIANNNPFANTPSQAELPLRQAVESRSRNNHSRYTESADITTTATWNDVVEFINELDTSIQNLYEDVFNDLLEGYFKSFLSTDEDSTNTSDKASSKSLNDEAMIQIGGETVSLSTMGYDAATGNFIALDILEKTVHRYDDQGILVGSEKIEETTQDEVEKATLGEANPDASLETMMEAAGADDDFFTSLFPSPDPASSTNNRLGLYLRYAASNLADKKMQQQQYENWAAVA